MSELTVKTYRKTVRLMEFDVVPYLPILRLQHQLVQARQENSIPDTLLLLEHDPVITLGRRSRPEHVLVTREMLQQKGIEVHAIERGGDVTYHGPGQIVGYPIIRIRDYKMGASDYMHSLEEVIIRALGEIGLVAHRLDNYIGVWIENRKIAALGARIKRGVAYHGFALNVDPDMEHFDLIVPCGIQDKSVTSVYGETGRPCQAGEVRKHLCHHFCEIFNVELERVCISREQSNRVGADVSALMMKEQDSG